VRFHGGKVSAFNRAEGGLMVEIRLPLIAGAGAVQVPGQVRVVVETP